MIYFDFDRTLIDTDSLKDEQAKRIGAITGLTPEQTHEGMRAYIKSLESHLDFTPEGYATFLENLYGVNPGDVLKIYVTDSNYVADFLFPEVLEVLTTLKKEGYSIGIFSAAMPGPQILKIEKTGVYDLVDKHLIIIDPRKLGIDALSQLPDGVMIVDDDFEVVSRLNKYSPRFTPVWCNRKSGEVNSVICTIHNLRELLHKL